MYLDKPITLRNTHRPSRRRGGPRSRGGAVIVVALLMVVNYFVFFRGGDEPAQKDLAGAMAAVGVAPAAQQAGAVQDGVAPREVDDFGQPVGRKLTGEIKRGQTIMNALRAVGIDSHSAQPIIQAMSEVFDFRKAQVGDTFSAHVDDDGQVTYFSYAQSPLDLYEVARTETGEYQARKKKVPTRVDVAHIGCAMKSSLYESITRCGEGAELAATLIDIFAWDVDFFQDVRDGDDFKVIVEKISVDGRFLRYGRVLAAQYRGKFGEYRIVSYRDPEGREGFYKPDGHAVRREFIKSPLKYTKVSADSQTGIRASVKTASPVIYTARANTPVWAVAGGTVISAGDSGGSLGRAITVKHDNGYTSTYAHLGSIAQGIKVGAMVKQKTVLGKVGSSGDADSPQLLFSLRKDGRLQNPLKLSYSEGEPVAPEHKARFEAEVKQLIEDLEATPVIGVHERRS
ncbi:MAG: M23 family metallopeptidase [Deltaproteobacteria bacterium]|jgi:murein DD-endopeptidase MepM/ murein hydrolase activator NlpD|nr:M23 family metallopeptidase [Deltaproteobacteria bacterium]